MNGKTKKTVTRANKQVNKKAKKPSAKKSNTSKNDFVTINGIKYSNKKPPIDKDILN